jgi:ATP-dependent DNA ligase
MEQRCLQISVSTHDRIIYSGQLVSLHSSAIFTDSFGMLTVRRVTPVWIKPQLAALAQQAPDGPGWLHEIKLDGYRMHARLHRSGTQRGALDAGSAKIITRRGKDWTGKYPTIAKVLLTLPTKSAYLDGELCGVLPDGRTAFNLIQNALDQADASLIYFVFDLLFLDGEDLTGLSLVDRKTRLEAFLVGAPDPIRYSDHQICHGPAFHRLASSTGSKASSQSGSTGDTSPTGAPGSR